MSIWSHLIDALKGDSEDRGGFTDSKALKVLDKEIRLADERLKESRDSLAEVLFHQKQTEQGMAEKKARIDELEDFARQALNQNNEALAREVVESIMPLEAEYQDDKEVLAEYRQVVSDVQLQIRHAELDLRQLKQQVATVKATASVQKAQATVTARPNGSPTAQQALARMKTQQAENAAQFQAQKAMSDIGRKNELLEKLKQAGIDTGSSKAQAVLDRIRGKE
ncbi:MAG: PspA/IM30 family protein [Reinekea sp.]|jgi:phage shock protein A